jgi:hypothetical protein
VLAPLSLPVMPSPSRASEARYSRTDVSPSMSGVKALRVFRWALLNTCIPCW